VSLILGVAAGTCIGYLIWAVPLQRQFANQYILSATDQAFIGLQVSQGQSDGLRKALEDSLPEYVINIASNYRSSPYATDALWVIRRYYERNGVPIPKPAEAILMNIQGPPSEACSRKLVQLEMNASVLPTQYFGTNEVEATTQAPEPQP
jgi:hypothetical protein